ncbi:MAG: hypothetical protein A3G05_01375 [Candidatus Zambryskibacteria bacterium RIFCSPLOWO2_12_FULL_45_14]|uniref:Uncharacterized protein n=2 Tax=Candidatus Zambryskiibacteriota TaxID=1817925 RepID=A0A1G2UKI9_9BACT|nr:MAG: hypothetical protein A3H60_00110 [Candidatus Zambryskibacteria bacterium RIFCSPLOWO2_02_FULL_44_12b]OHB13832.1 MAG: hypothetical protein A3G05_01375 [Candidatus Zambryskibacteria bacterium RIFCSPLOWO2_12_FULL_45_14]
MTILDQIAGKIIKEQELIIGPLAWEEAGHVIGLHAVDKKTWEVSIEESIDKRTVIDKLVAQYDRLFGRASREVSREAAAPFLTGLAPTEIPSSLK